MTGVVVQGLEQRRGSDFRVEVSELHLPEGSSTLVLGPSGSGKSSFLRLLAGLERPHRGTIHMHGVAVAGPTAWVPPHRRGAALLSQDFGLWPHLSAAKHLAFVRTRGDSLVPVKEDYEILEQVGLGAKGDVRPCALSGGEQQRLALARALAARPRLLLLDEPFANVDVVLTRQLHDLVTLLRCTWGFTLVQVAHHAQHTVATADTVAIFQGGALRQSGTWASIVQAPGDPWVHDVVEAFA